MGKRWWWEEKKNAVVIVEERMEVVAVGGGSPSTLMWSEGGVSPSDGIAVLVVVGEERVVRSPHCRGYGVW
jgi:hypothetical protein